MSAPTITPQTTPTNYCAQCSCSDKDARIAELEAALLKIAAFDDVKASAVFDRTGSFSAFDEPGSVELARKALNHHRATD